jgi:hypothetical protein
MRKMAQLEYGLKSISRSPIKKVPLARLELVCLVQQEHVYGIAYIPSQTLWFRCCTRPVSLIASK